LHNRESVRVSRSTAYHYLSLLGRLIDSWSDVT